MKRFLGLSILALLMAGAARGDEVVDHSKFDRLLSAYVSDEGFVDYAGWKGKDVRTLRRYLAQMSGINASTLSRREQLAYWINIYNALTIDGILQFYPLKSIKEKASYIGGFNIWDDYPVLIRGESYSLNHVEHEILRKMDEPRIHFGIVCASIGCPKLRNEAFTGAKLEMQLEENARDFFSHSRNIQIDVKRKQVRLSSIMKWFKEDFGKTAAERMAFVAPYVSDPAQRQLLESGEASLKHLKYDWGLNGK